MNHCEAFAHARLSTLAALCLIGIGASAGIGAEPATSMAATTTIDLARDVRTLDMQASPYDLRDLGYAPVAIETPAGKATYAAAQRAFAEQLPDAQPRRA